MLRILHACTHWQTSRKTHCSVKRNELYLVGLCLTVLLLSPRQQWCFLAFDRDQMQYLVCPCPVRHRLGKWMDLVQITEIRLEASQRSPSCCMSRFGREEEESCRAAATENWEINHTIWMRFRTGRRSSRCADPILARGSAKISSSAPVLHSGNVSGANNVHST